MRRARHSGDDDERDADRPRRPDVVDLTGPVAAPPPPPPPPPPPQQQQRRRVRARVRTDEDVARSLQRSEQRRLLRADELLAMRLATHDGGGRAGSSGSGDHDHDPTGFGGFARHRARYRPMPVPVPVAHYVGGGGIGGVPEPDDYEGLLALAERLGDVKHKGASAVAIAALPRVVHGASTGDRDNRRCVVCTEDFAAGEQLLVLPLCLHRFHTECITPALRINAHCPICRAAIGDR